jgi:hypothetical protein
MLCVKCADAGTGRAASCDEVISSEGFAVAVVNTGISSQIG